MERSNNRRLFAQAFAGAGAAQMRELQAQCSTRRASWVGRYVSTLRGAGISVETKRFISVRSSCRMTHTVVSKRLLPRTDSKWDRWHLKTASVFLVVQCAQMPDLKFGRPSEVLGQGG